MAYADRWLLPDGVEEILPGEAQQVETLRRQILDLFGRWGYDLVIPPLVEYTESLLIGLGRDLDLLTFKMTDQLSGRTLGVRADITPQIARMDAHSLRRQGSNRLCYSGHVLHTQAKSPLATRSPFQIGVELFGEAGLSGDSEVISLLLECLQTAGISDTTIEIGHVAIYRGLVTAAGLNAEQQEVLFEMLQRKAVTEIRDWVAKHVADKYYAEVFQRLPFLSGEGDGVWSQAHELLKRASKDVLLALDELQHVAQVVAKRYPAVKLYFDLSELPSFGYHTGIVFAAFVPGLGREVASGGRYDHVGDVFGRARPATGFSVFDLAALYKLAATANNKALAQAAGIFVAETDDPQQWNEIQALRDNGERVVVSYSGRAINREELNCDRQLILQNGKYQVVDWK